MYECAGCGIWLYQFLIIAYPFTLPSKTAYLKKKNKKKTYSSRNLSPHWILYRLKHCANKWNLYVLKSLYEIQWNTTGLKSFEYIYSYAMALKIDLVGWLCWGLTSQSTIFQSCRDGAIASWVINQYFRGVKCLAQGHNTAAVGFEPRTSRSGVRHSTTEPPRSPKDWGKYAVWCNISPSLTAP